MATRSTRAERGSLIARRGAAAIGRELRDYRLGYGLSQAAVARAARLSQSQVSRLERGEIAKARLDHLSRVAVVLGLALSLKLYPSGEPVRDAGQLALIARLAARLHPALRLRREAPLPIPGDRRAWDAKLEASGCGVEAEVHLHDTQELSRRIALKLRDDPTVDRVILLVARSAHNRAVLRDHREALRAQFPLDGVAILGALRRGDVPPSSGIVML